jgi:transglutaminase-like putative cysteine protease
MIRNVTVKVMVALTAAAGGSGLLMLPAYWALRGRGPVVVDGLETIEDAVAACRRSALQGWDLVAFAQRLVYHKYAFYSCRNLWDTPAQSFRRGMGYCTQYNLALKAIFDALGLDTQAVFSLRVRVTDEPDWSMGHTWLRVRIGGDVREVCAGHAGNAPGEVHFEPLLPVFPGFGPVLFASHLGMILFCGSLEWRAFLTRRPVPSWMFQDRAAIEAHLPRAG